MLKNRILYLFALIGGAWLMVMYQSYDTIMAMVLLVVLPFILLFLFLWVTRHVEVRIHVSDDVISKQDEDGIPITIEIENSCRIPLTSGKLMIAFQNRYVKRGKECLNIAAVAMNTTQIVYSLKANHVGNVDIDIESIKYYDLFGIWSKKVNIGNKINVSVLPEIDSIELDADMLRMEEEEENEKYRDDIPGNDRGEVFDIREYGDGDQFRNIHWKLSMKKGNLMVKEFSMPLSKKPLIFLNFQKVMNENGFMDLDSLDHLLEVAMSLSLAMIFEQVAHYISWADMSAKQTFKKLVEEEDQISEAVQEVLLADLNSEYSEIEGILGESSESEFSRIFYITPTLNETVINYLYSVKEKVGITIMYVTKEEENPAFRDLCMESEIELLTVNEAKDIELNQY